MMSKTNGILEQIESALSVFEYPVFYGKTFIGSNERFDYFVFNRQRIEHTGKTQNDFSYYYQVHIIMEDYIPESFEVEVIKAILNNTKLKLANNAMTYQYTTKGGTDIVVELLTITFVLPVRGCMLME